MGVSTFYFETNASPNVQMALTEEILQVETDWIISCSATNGLWDSSRPILCSDGEVGGGGVLVC